MAALLLRYVDMESLAFLQAFLSQTTKCNPIIIATRGDDDDDAGAGKGGGSSHSHAAHVRTDTRQHLAALARVVSFKFEFQLVRLETDACCQLIRRIFAESSTDVDPYGIATVHQGVVDFIYSRSAGNPL